VSLWCRSPGRLVAAQRWASYLVRWRGLPRPSGTVGRCRWSLGPYAFWGWPGCPVRIRWWRVRVAPAVMQAFGSRRRTGSLRGELVKPAPREQKHHPNHNYTLLYKKPHTNVFYLSSAYYVSVLPRNLTHSRIKAALQPGSPPLTGNSCWCLTRAVAFVFVPGCTSTLSAGPRLLGFWWWLVAFFYPRSGAEPSIPRIVLCCGSLWRRLSYNVR